MSEYMFGLHSGHLTAKADRIARKHGAVHINYTEPNGRRRGWFAGPNLGAPFDGEMGNAVWRDIERAGGLNALRYKRDQEEEPQDTEYSQP